MTKYERVEAELGTPLKDRLLYWQTCGVSCPAIARMIAHETGIQLSPEGIRRWLRALDEDAA